MKLYLVQHGKAMSKAQDSQRPLTDEGRREAEEVARFVAPLGLRIGRLWHSGKLRAAQTAEIYTQAVTADGRPVAREGLAPGDNVALLRDDLAVATDDTMIVGHLPFVAKLAALLLTGHETPSVVTFKHAGIVCLGRTDDPPAGQWQVEWIVTPDLLGYRGRP